MPDDHMFRNVLLAIMVIVFPFALYHRIRSQATRERLDRRQEGLFILATLRPVGFSMLTAIVVYLANPRSMAWSSLALPVAVRWAGVGLSLIATGLLMWTLRSLGKNLTDTVVTRRDHTLVTRGPYRWVRHPFYDTVALLLIAVALITANWFILVAAVVWFALLIVRTRIEEEKLVARFGDAYRTYMRRTGRFVPRLRRG
jgi:protein-S-isoprenylcysteine O-methyltransferase Ste14